MNSGSIYILQVGDDGPIKIGFTKSCVKQRIRAHQTGSPHILRWIGCYSGTRADELAAHHFLKDSSLRGEWFHPTQDVLDFVRRMSPDFQPVIVENVLFKPRHTGRGSGVRPVSVLKSAEAAQ